MKRIPGILVLAVLMLTMAATAETVDEIIAKNIEAKGGLEALQAIESLQSNGKLTMQGMEIPFVMYNQRPNSFRMDMTMQGMSMVQAFDGETAWTINPFLSKEAREMSALEAQNTELQADIDGFLLNYKEKGYTVDLIGKEDMEGTEVYHLEVGINDTVQIQMFLDTEYYLELKMTFEFSFEGKKFSTDIFFADYKEVGGVLMPHTMEMKGMQGGGQMIVDSVAVNVELEESLFTMPVVKEEPPAKEGE